MDHLQKAREYVARGDEFYAKAADEIIAAMAADSTLSYRQIAETVGRSATWCKTIVSWRTNGQRADETPFSGSEYASRQAESHAKRVLREATPEQLEDIVSSLPNPAISAAWIQG